MLNVRVQCSKWQCLKCSRVFTSKFCYILHCKNVHNEDQGQAVIEFDGRPFCDVSGKSEQRENSRCTANGDAQNVSANRPTASELSSVIAENGDSTKNSDKRIHTCDVCKKSFSSSARLESHKNLHTSTNGAKRRQHKRSKEGSSSGKKAQEQVYEDQSQVINDGQSGSKTNKNDHVYGVLNSELKEQQNVAMDVQKLLSMNAVGKADGELNHMGKDKKSSASEGSSQYSTPLPVNRKRGRPKKDQPQESVIEQPVNVEFEEKLVEQTLVFPEIPAEVKSGKKRSGARKKSRECDVCHKIFANRSSLREHLRMHTGEKPYICSVCEKGFIRMGHLRQHMCSHTGLWPFKCGACGKGFMNPSRVTRHMRVHNDERPCVCDECGETFKEPHHLTRHMHLHSGVKPFKCPLCKDRYFIQAGNLKIHMKTHQGEIAESTVTIGDVSHEISLSSTSQATEDGNTAVPEENMVAIEGLLLANEAKVTVSNGSDQKNSAVESTVVISTSNASVDGKMTVTIEEGAVIEHSVEALKENMERTEQNEETTEGGVVGSQIVLQILPSADQDLSNLQTLTSLDPELLRQLASSVANELNNQCQ